MLMITYIRTLNLMKVNIIRKNIGFYCDNNQKSIDVLNIAIKCGVISGFKAINSKRIYVKLNVDYKCPNISVISTPNNKKHIKLSNIKKLNNKKTYSQYILLTSNGICTMNMAEKKYTGGIVLAKLD